MKYVLTVLLLACLGIGCSSKRTYDRGDAYPLASQENAKPTRPTLVATKRAALPASTPAKGRFLDYIYQIEPDHKKEGYSISTAQLNDGYAYGSGPYDGWFLEFFLFRGKSFDLVFRQVTGYEVPDADQPYGAKIEPFLFTGGQVQTMKKVSLDTVLPLQKTDALFTRETEKLKSKPQFAGWKFHRLLKLPIQGTTVLLKACQMSPEPPFLTETSCVTLAELRWNKIKFELRPLRSNKLTTEGI